MTARDWSGLREAASNAGPEKLGERGQDYRDRWRRFEVAANPAAIIELLDELDAAREALARVGALADEFKARHEYPAFSGDYGIDSTASACWYDAEGMVRAALAGVDR